MRIAILGWGSLIWCPRGLPQEGSWEKGGPHLPIEFSRISSDGRITLVIDPTNGESVPTRFALSPRADLEDAICDLRTREGTTATNIGFIDLKHGTERCKVYPKAAAVIHDWAKGKEFDGVVWTDLPPNFQDELRMPFSLENAQKYLNGLPKSVAQQARKYIQNAPPEVDTPLRRNLLQSGWLKS